jgi:excinuclease ABC subunit C
MLPNISNIVSRLPAKPGIYQFFNSDSDIIYIGKAKNLKSRVSSYFSKNRYDSAKIRILVSKISDIKYTLVDTESDALLLENNLIKKYRPKYNILLKDDKTYPWVCIKNESFPRVYSTRRIVTDGSKYFGPYTSGVVLKTLLGLIKQLYPLRNCNLNLTRTNIKLGKFNSCLEFQIGNCKAPCIGNQSESDYNDNITSISDILRGNLSSVIHAQQSKMISLAQNYQFEEAQICKNKIEILNKYQSKSTIVSQSYSDIDVFSLVDKTTSAFVNYLKVVNGAIMQSHSIELKRYLEETPEELLGYAIADIRIRLGSKAKEILVPFDPDFKLDNTKYIIPKKSDKLKLLQLSERNCKEFALTRQMANDNQKSASSIQRILSTLKSDFRLTNLPVHIECFDNSNLQGTNPVAACVVFKNAKPAKREYRHFNIKTVEGANDFASMYEVVYRRYKRLIDEDLPLPQLVVVDGGKGQLSSAYQAMVELDLSEKVKLIGIAKRLEEIFFPNDSVPLYLDKNSESLKVIQNARNEAHRFGITFHRLKRSKSSTHSELSNIKGVGEKTIQLLLKKYGSIEELKKLPLNIISSDIGESRAALIVSYFTKTLG